MVEPLIDFAILTALKDERDAVLKAFGLKSEHRIRKEDKRTYWCGPLKLKDGEFYQIVVAQSPDQAGINAALLANETIHDWAPGAMLLVGIAGAASEEQKPGDLVIGEHSYYYERGKMTPAGIKPEPYIIPANFILSDRIESLPKWKTRRRRPDGRTVSPKIHSGVIAAGEKVIADSAIRDNLAFQHRKIMAVEMESYGFSQAAWQSFSQVPHLVIKAIQDSADASKNDKWRQYAVGVAAAYTKHFLLDRPLKPRNSPRLPVPPQSQYQPIIKELKFGNIVPFLGPGISPDLYIQLASHLSESIEEDLLHEPIWNASENRNLIRQLFGVPCQVCHYLPDQRPPECPMLKGIERVEDCPLYIEQGLAVAKMNLRYLSQYYKLTDISLRTFYDKLCEIIESFTPKQIHQFFAELPHQMFAKNYPRRCPGLPYQLIVTTNCDSLLEQSFENINQPYDVIYYVADGDERGNYKHRLYQAKAAQIISDPQNYDQLPLRSTGSISGSRKPHPIILKLYGTWENNFVVTEDHLNRLVSSPIKNLPAGLIKILNESGILFLGYSPNDSELQLIVHWLWQDKKLPGGSRLVHQSQPGDLEQKIWKKQRNVELLRITCSPEDFVASLKQEVEDLKPRQVAEQIR